MQTRSTAEAATDPNDVLRPYVPRLLVQWVDEMPDRTWREIDGSMVFVDISGFTKLSERLAKLGKMGAEEVSAAIGTCFAGLLAVAYANGGSLLKFGGDALLLFFTGGEHEARACSAAAWMRRTLRDIGRFDTPGGKVLLRMSVGVHSGLFDFFLVGRSHRELIVTGPAVSSTVSMESTAVAGEILVSLATAASLPSDVFGEEKGGVGRLLRSAPRVRSLDPGVLEPSRMGLDLEGYVPRAVRAHLLAGGGDPEHRLVTVAFLHFDGTDDLIEHEGPEAAAAALGELIRDVQDAVDEHEVAFLASDIDRDGGKIILTAGVPYATGNDEERMLRAVRQIGDGNRQIALRTGVNRGSIFAGDIGPAYRRTYTIMGDAVNLAARVMAKAEQGQILSTGGVLERSSTRFDVAALEPFLVKGKAKPVEAFSLGAATGTVRGARGELPLIGRDAEVAVLERSLAAVRARWGIVLEVIGDPGMGKSRLVEELEARASDLTKLSVACELYESGTPYYPFKLLMRDLLGIVPSAPDELVEARLRDRLVVNAPQLLPWLPLLAIPADLELPATPETEALEEEFLRSRLAEVMTEFLAVALPTPTLVLVEDVHWMDESSAELLGHIARAAVDHPWLICVTRRGGEEGFHAPREDHLSVLELASLETSDAAALLVAASEDVPLPEDEIIALVQRAGGNPLFLRELLSLRRASTSLGGLPESVEALVTAQIDRLRPSDRAILRSAAVLGSRFSAELLDALLEDGERPEPASWSRLESFLGRDEGGSLYFKNALMRDAAYEGLPFRRRRTLHERVGEAIERAAGEEVEDQAGVLSLHFFNAQSFDRAWRYARLAADRAQAKHAIAEAERFYRRALDAARRVEEVPPDDVAAVSEGLGDVRERLGRYPDAEAAYRAARKLVAGNRIAEARLYLKQARIPERSGRYSDALRWLRRGLTAVEGLDEQEAARVRAQLSVWYAAVRQGQGRAAEAMKWCRQAIEQAEAAGEPEALAHAYFISDWVLAEMGQWRDASNSERALEIYEGLGNRGRQATIWNNLGAFAYWAGRWDEAVELYEKGRDARKQIGDVVDAAMGTNNIGEIMSDQGRLEEAETMFREALRVWKAAGFQQGVAFATMNLARVAYRSGRFEEATALLDSARSQFRAVGADTEVLETDTRSAECLLFSGETGAALELVERTLERASAGGGTNVQAPMLFRIRGYALMQQGHYPEAEEALMLSMEVARVRKAEHELAFTLDALTELARRKGEKPASDVVAEMDSIYRRLGIASRSAVLPPPVAV